VYLLQRRDFPTKTRCTLTYSVHYVWTITGWYARRRGIYVVTRRHLQAPCERALHFYRTALPFRLF